MGAHSFLALFLQTWNEIVIIELHTLKYDDWSHKIKTILFVLFYKLLCSIVFGHCGDVVVDVHIAECIFEVFLAHLETEKFAACFEEHLREVHEAWTWRHARYRHVGDHRSKIAHHVGCDTVVVGQTYLQ